MTFITGNKAIRDQASDGKDLLLFEHLRKSKGYRFVGNFACASWEWRTAPDRNNTKRQVIVFHLLRQEQVESSDLRLPTLAKLSLKEIRRKAYEASSTGEERDTKERRRLYYERAEEVRAYVLARAKEYAKRPENAHRS